MLVFPDPIDPGIVRFCYCSHINDCGTWYWSLDGNVWHMERILVVQRGEQEGKRLAEVDLDRLYMVNCTGGIQTSVGDQYCPVCRLLSIKFV